MKRNNKTEAAILDWLGDGAALIDTIDDDSTQTKPMETTEHNNRLPFVRKTESFELIPSTRCFPWNYADRLEEEMGDLKSLEESIKNHGQQEPILVRPNNTSKYEIIFGNRRWRACKNLNIPIKAIIKHLSDQEAAIAQKEENENRQSISDYSKAMFYKKLLDNGVFTTEKHLADTMKIPKQTFNDLMSYTRIDESILKNILLPSKLGKKMAAKLASISKKMSSGMLSSAYIEALFLMLPEIGAKKISYRTIDLKLEQLMLEKEEPQHSILNNSSFKFFETTKDTAGNVSITIKKDFLTHCQLCDIEKALSYLIKSKNYKT